MAPRHLYGDCMLCDVIFVLVIVPTNNMTLRLFQYILYFCKQRFKCFNNCTLGFSTVKVRLNFKRLLQNKRLKKMCHSRIITFK